MIRTALKRGANRPLGMLGLKLVTGSELSAVDAIHRLRVQELHDCIKGTVLPDLPLREGRVGLLTQLLGTGVCEAMFLLDALHKVVGLQGDICEFGVAQGHTSALLANEIAGTSKHLWLYDSFQGLPESSDKDKLLDDIFGLGSMERYKGQMAFGAGRVLAELSAVGFPRSRTHIIQGFVDATMRDEDLPPKVCFAYLDLDLYEGTRAALQLLHPKLEARSRVVVDDYGYFSSGVQEAVEEFLKEHESVYEFVKPPDFAGNFCILIKS